MIRKTGKGFSLLESFFVVGLILAAIAISVQIFVTSSKSYRVLMVYLSAYLKGRETIDFISKDCRVAVRIMDEYAGYTCEDNCLVLKLPSVNASGDIIDVDNKFDYMIYRISDSDLWKTVIPGSMSSRPASDGVFKKSMESLDITFNGTSLSDIPHKSIITRMTLRASVVETFAGQEYRVTPGTTVKLMNYEWDHVR